VRFQELQLAGAFLVEIEPLEDERGFFARTFCEQEFALAGLATRFVQTSVSYNRAALTLRGMHYQAAPHSEVKLVRCVAGRIHDVIVDLRRDSPTRLRSLAVELDAHRRSALYIPAGFAHGFLTLEAGCEVSYQMTTAYVKEAARGVRWNDKHFAIRWPAEPLVMADRDRGYPDFDPDRFDG
jgi:dTDP-4-dehydrorhamnose 3,5-epimerase